MKDTQIDRYRNLLTKLTASALASQLVHDACNEDLHSLLYATVKFYDVDSKEQERQYQLGMISGWLKCEQLDEALSVIDADQLEKVYHVLQERLDK